MDKAPQNSLFTAAAPVLGEVEAKCRRAGMRWVIGVDEVGRGPLAGPVYAAAVVLDLERLDAEWIGLLDDSKKLSPHQRERAAEAIREGAVAYSICARDQQVIDEINILQATMRAMEEAIVRVCEAMGERPDRIFIDGNRPVQSDLPQETVIKGDGRSFHIAAASIVAKVERDRLMVDLHERWPEYNFASNKGYGSREHRDAIALHGPCSLHRLSFGGVREHVARLRR